MNQDSADDPNKEDIMNNSVSLKIKLFIAVISIGILYTLFVAVMASLPVSYDDAAFPDVTTAATWADYVDEMTEEERQQALDNYDRFKEEVKENIFEQEIEEQIEYIEQQG